MYIWTQVEEKLGKVVGKQTQVSWQTHVINT